MVGLAGGGVGLLVATPIFIVMGFVVAAEEPAELPASSDSVEGVIASPSTARAATGAPFVYGRVRTYATYRRGGRRMFDSVVYVDEDRGDPRVTLQTAGGPVEVVLAEPMTTWRNAHPETVSYDSPAQMPNWQRHWSPPQRAREYVNYLIAVRTGDRLLVDRATNRVWIGGRAAGDSAMGQHEETKRRFSFGSFAAGGLCALGSFALLLLGLRSRR